MLLNIALVIYLDPGVKPNPEQILKKTGSRSEFLY